jgi:hypothetical protein
MTHGKEDRAAPQGAKRPDSARRKRARKQLRPDIDWSFADLIDSDGMESAEIKPLLDGDLEECGEVDGLASMCFTPQYYRRTLPCSDDDIRSFAEEFGIDNSNNLQDTFAIVAKEIDQVEPKPSWIMKWRDDEWAVEESYAAAHAQAVEHADALLELLSGPFWPVALDKKPESARRALIKYRR